MTATVVTTSAAVSKKKVTNDGEERGSGADSGWSGVSDNSSTDSEGTILEASSVASDQTGLTLERRPCQETSARVRVGELADNKRAS